MIKKTSYDILKLSQAPGLCFAPDVLVCTQQCSLLPWNLNQFEYSGFKAKVALEALRNTMTIAEIATHYNVASSLVSKWKSNGKVTFNL